VRNRGTLGGSLCQADPSEDLSAVCTAVNASCVIRGSGGERVVPMEDFHRGPYETRSPTPRSSSSPHPGPAGRSAYEKVERGPATGLVSAGRASGWRRRIVADAGGWPRGSQHHRHPGDLRGAARHEPSEELYARAGAIAPRLRAVTDQRGSADYKRHLATS
jgi:carbon-monoxide dehydrogenase medium subunit